VLIDTLTCPACMRALRIPNDLLGQEVKCPSCGSTFTAPSSLDAPPPPPPRPPEPAPERRPEPPPRRHDDRDDWPRPRRYEDDDNRYRPRRRDDRPSKVQALGVMTLVGGILALVVSLAWMATCVGFFWPGTYYSVVLGALAIVKGAQVLGEHADREGSPQAVCVMQVINVVNLDVVNMTLGIIGLVFLNEPEVRDFFRY